MYFFVFIGENKLTYLLNSITFTSHQHAKEHQWIICKLCFVGGKSNYERYIKIIDKQYFQRYTSSRW